MHGDQLLTCPLVCPMVETESYLGLLGDEIIGFMGN